MGGTEGRPARGACPCTPWGGVTGSRRRKRKARGRAAPLLIRGVRALMAGVARRAGRARGAAPRLASGARGARAWPLPRRAHIRGRRRTCAAERDLLSANPTSASRTRSVGRSTMTANTIASQRAQYAAASRSGAHSRAPGPRSARASHRHIVGSASLLGPVWSSCLSRRVGTADRCDSQNGGVGLGLRMEVWVWVRTTT